MEILTFDICGKFAHFRKYYANNTAMTFSLPPRTTIIGIIAGAMGLPKDSYYEDLKSDNIRIGVNILTEIKKTFHRVNFLMIKSSSDFRGRKGRIQTPFEIVSGIDPKRDFVKYRIFISANAKGIDFFDRIKLVFLNNQFVYNPTLGTANFSANIENIQFYLDSESKVICTGNDFVELNSACLSEDIESLSFEKDEAHFYNMIEEELMPADFISNNNRELNKMNRILFSSGNLPLKVKLKSPVYKITKNGISQTIQFLD